MRNYMFKNRTAGGLTYYRNAPKYNHNLLHAFYVKNSAINPDK